MMELPYAIGFFYLRYCYPSSILDADALSSRGEENIR